MASVEPRHGIAMSSLYTRLKITLGRADADAEALAALESTPSVRVTTGNLLSFVPATGNPTSGIILYPGGRCDSRAYAPLMQGLAAAGYACFVPIMPLRLAVLAPNRATAIMAANPAIQRWFIGGHSMGGAMAAAYVYKHPEVGAGLFFLASYPSNMHAMPARELAVTLIHGTRDFVTRPAEFAQAGERLPAHTRFVAVEGGDHYQFGC
ncbi:MAG: alpha/beta family hydrolase, partial [Gammaproteobacteria bacterium]|nr:alpha/beta family hydrolase [Gammaproteobacteria bacterium]